MRNFFNKKPTSATYFQSESERNRTSRLNFIYGSKQLVAVLSVLVVGSLIAGGAIVQKSRDSEAATVTENHSVSWNKNDANVKVSRWKPAGTPGFEQYAEVAKNENLVMSLKSGPAYPDGYEVCFEMKPGGIGEAQNFRYTSANFAYSTNEAGANGVAISVDNQRLPISGGQPHKGGATYNQNVSVDFTGLPGGGLKVGQTIKFCNYKINSAKNKADGISQKLLEKKTVTLYAYSFRASYDTVKEVAEPKPEQTTENSTSNDQQNTSQDGMATSLSGEPSSEPKTSNKPTVFFLGDSVMVGMRDQGKLKSKMQRYGWEVTNIEATGGRSAKTVLANGDVQRNEDAIKRSDVIVIHLGGNDRYMDDFGRQANILIQRIRKINGNDPTIYWVNAYGVGVPYSGSAWETVNKKINNLTGVDRVIDFASEARQRPSRYPFLADNIHNTPLGYSNKAAFLVNRVDLYTFGKEISNDDGSITIKR